MSRWMRSFQSDEFSINAQLPKQPKKSPDHNQYQNPANLLLLPFGLSLWASPSAGLLPSTPDERYGRKGWLIDGEWRWQRSRLCIVQECTGRSCRSFSHGMTHWFRQPHHDSNHSIRVYIIRKFIFSWKLWNEVLWEVVVNALFKDWKSRS